MANSIFDKGEKVEDFKDKVDTHSKALLTVTQRQKDLESTLDTINEKIELIDHNSVSNFRKITLDIKDLRTDLKELREEITYIKDFNSKVAKQIKLMSTQDEVKKLEKYIDLWNPMNFLTRDELEEFRSNIKKDFEEIIESFLKEDKN